MKSRHIYSYYLQDMLDASLKATTFTKDMSFEEFEKDEKTQYAVIRALEIVGEASKKVPMAFKERNPGIPWRAISGMRDKVIHDYMGINHVVVWKTVIEDLPPLIVELMRIIKAE